MSRRSWLRKTRHEFVPELSWDESAVFCRRCSQSEASWQHEPNPPWWQFWRR